jgi:hypothetical protein
MTPDTSSFRRERCAARAAVVLGVALAFGCRSRSVVERDVPERPTTPDRLTREERLPEAETAFGLPIPQGMRLARHFSDAAYFSGELAFDRALEHVRRYVEAREVQMLRRGAVFTRAYIKGDESRRLFRIEISETPRGSQVHVKNVTPPPATKGASEADLWSRAGRKPDGTPIDQNQLY